MLKSELIKKLNEIEEDAVVYFETRDKIYRVNFVKLDEDKEIMLSATEDV